MQTTTNYQLPKWEKSDRIQMADFNDLTVGLDAALARALPQVIFDETLTADTAHFNHALDLDWTQWREIHIEVTPASGSSASLEINWGNTTGLLLTKMDTTYNHLVGYPNGNPNAPLVMLALNYEGGKFVRGKTVYENIEQLGRAYYQNFDYLGVNGELGTYKLKAGSRIKMWGYKI